MQVLTGTKREITLFQWIEQIEKQQSRLSDAIKCFKAFKEESDIDSAINRARILLYTPENAADSLRYMNKNNIK